MHTKYFEAAVKYQRGPKIKTDTKTKLQLSFANTTAVHAQVVCYLFIFGAAVHRQQLGWVLGSDK